MNEKLKNIPDGDLWVIAATKEAAHEPIQIAFADKYMQVWDVSLPEIIEELRYRKVIPNE